MKSVEISSLEPIHEWVLLLFPDEDYKVTELRGAGLVLRVGTQYKVSEPSLN